MSLPDPTKLTEAVQRGRLTSQNSAELQRYLAAHPQERTAWEEELGLNDLLRQVPEVPLSSNFTAQVLQAARRQDRARSAWVPGTWRLLLTRHWVPKLATGLSILAAGLFAFHYHLNSERELALRQELARNLADISKGGDTLELLKNFDAIQRLGRIPRDSDARLIAALQ